MTSFAEIMAMPPRDNAEGWVVWLDPVTAVKVKYEAYVELHRIVTGLNRKSVWRALSKGEDVYRAMAAQLPDELFDWAEDVAKELREQYAEIVREVDANYLHVLDVTYDFEDENLNRAEFAEEAKRWVPGNLLGLVFATLDGKDIQDKVWSMIEPKGSER